MKIVSWNVCFRNSDRTGALRFIAELDCDILCLQEVPEHMLAELKKLPYHLATAVDVDRLFPSGTERNYLVIRSRFPVLGSGSVPFTVPHLPWRTRLFVWLMRHWHWTKIEGRNGLWADIDVGGMMLRVFCLHLLLAYPSVRAREFERAMRSRDGKNMIVCGDFNILEYPKGTILNWILGGPFIDALRFTRERTDMEQRFASYRLTNPLRGKATHNYSRKQQLSHILVPQGSAVRQARVFPGYHGSDHRPVLVEVDARSRP